MDVIGNLEMAAAIPQHPVGALISLASPIAAGPPRERVQYQTLHVS